MPSSEPRPKVTIEDLIRLKRAEQPAPEFWNNFERELRQKQLAALLEKRPWWQTLPQVLTRRTYLPLGATALLAFTLVSLKYHAPVQLTPALTVAVAAPVLASTPTANAPAAVAVSAPVASAPIEHHESVAPAAVVAASVPAAASEMMSTLVAPPTVESPSARSIAANLARLEQTEPELVSAVLGNRLSPPARAQAAAVNATELASVPVDGSKRGPHPCAIFRTPAQPRSPPRRKSCASASPAGWWIRRFPSA